ncbi:MAG: nuclear transport factor 2 family protein [Gemmatimonadales bacterium]
MSPASEEARNLAVIRGYYAAIAHGAAALDWMRWFAPEVIQEEFPNRLLPAGTRRDLDGLQAAAQRGQTLLAQQEFEILHLMASGNKVLVEAEWRAQVARDAGPLRAGAQMRTRFAQVLELHDGKIVALRNYDCFYPWE